LILITWFLPYSISPLQF